MNDAGCVILDGNILIAPYGSTVLPDGSGVTFTGWGQIMFGQPIPPNVGGGYMMFGERADVDAELLDCRSTEHPEEEYVVMYPPIP